MKDPCECLRCNEIRMLAAWCLLVDADDAKARVSARLLLTRWERVLAAGEHPTSTPPRQHELDALQYCADWIRANRRSLARLDRHVAIAGTVLDN